MQEKLSAPDCRYDLVVCDEAHKMSATFFGGEVKYTKRYRLGQLLSGLTRHFLLMTATPHNGKEEDFQLFLALLDGDRFEGQVPRRRASGGRLRPDAPDGEGEPAQVRRHAALPRTHRLHGPLQASDAEARLYKGVTDYVREEFNRAEALQNDKRAGTVGFALTILQRRLASSPEAIYQSLRRRRERLESGCASSKLSARRRGARARRSTGPELDAEDIEDLEEAPEDEVEAAEEEILDQATAAATIAELKAERGRSRSLIDSGCARGQTSKSPACGSMQFLERQRPS